MIEGFRIKMLNCLMIASLLFGSVAAAAAPKRAAARTIKAEPPACAALKNDFETASKRLAFNSALSMGGAKSEGEETAILTKAQMTMDLLRSNGCKAPTAAPSAGRYRSQAFACSSDLQKRRIANIINGGRPDTTDPISCDGSQWKPETE